MPNPSNNVGIVGGVNPPNVLAAQLYAPASQQTYNANVGALTALDTVNLSVGPFEVPSSGNYFVDVGMDWAYASNGSLSVATDMFLGLALHGTTVPICPIQSWCGSNQPNFVNGAHHAHRYFVTGQTPFSQQQLDLIMGISSTTNISFASFYAWAGSVLSNNPTAPALIQVFSA